MDTHVKVLGVLYIVVSALHFCAALFLLLAVGGAASIVGLTADARDAAIAVPILGIAGTAIAGILLILSLPGLVAGWGLLGFKPWARILGLVLSVINLLNIPFGTAVGIYGLWVLFHKDTERLFNRPTTIPTTA
jgi:hypothetical protein